MVLTPRKHKGSFTFKHHQTGHQAHTPLSTAAQCHLTCPHKRQRGACLMSVLYVSTSGDRADTNAGHMYFTPHVSTSMVMSAHVSGYTWASLAKISLRRRTCLIFFQRLMPCHIPLGLSQVTCQINPTYWYSEQSVSKSFANDLLVFKWLKIGKCNGSVCIFGVTSDVIVVPAVAASDVQLLEVTAF